MKYRYVTALFAAFLIAGNFACTTNVSREANSTNSVSVSNAPIQTATKTEHNAVASNYPKSANSESNQRVNPRAAVQTGIDSQAKSRCLTSKMNGKKIVEKQTFPIEFAPFEESCFVTFASPEFGDLNLDGEFFIYKNGKEIFKFPDQFNGVTTGCWIEGVSFADLNDDSLTDILIAGKCSAKTAPYQENMFYVNTGDGFTTDMNANRKIENFKKAKDIENFVRAHQQEFFQ